MMPYITSMNCRMTSQTSSTRLLLFQISVVCGIKHFLMECNRLLALHSTLPSSQFLSYDTTFQLGDFYLSPLLFRNTLFQKSPVMPVMHERKLKSTHTEMMKIILLSIIIIGVTIYYNNNIITLT